MNNWVLHTNKSVRSHIRDNHMDVLVFLFDMNDIKDEVISTIRRHNSSHGSKKPDKLLQMHVKNLAYRFHMPAQCV